jgi:two-component system OmpR family sensor kinase
MRFDDRLRTVLKSAEPQGQAAVIQYRQLMDLIARVPSQNIPANSLQLLSDGLVRLHALRDVVSKPERVSIVQSLSGQLKSMVLLRYLLADHGAIANAAIKAARLSDSEWAQLVPEMSVMARGALRLRRDLGPKTVEKLAQYGVSDQVLTASRQAANDAAQSAGTNQSLTDQMATLPDDGKTGEKSGQSISEIVQRIEAFRATRHAEQQNRSHPALAPFDNAEGDTPLLPFVEELPDDERLGEISDRRHIFFADSEGRFTHADGIPFGALFGLELARAAFPGSPGVDAAIASVFQRRAPIHKGRLTLAGGKSIAGIWLIEAEPVFVADSGRFSGYRGYIRRPEPMNGPTSPMMRVTVRTVCVS